MITLLLALAATPAPSPHGNADAREPRVRAAAGLVRACLDARAAQLDDRISDAATIGKVVAELCSAPVQDLVRVQADGRDPKDLSMIRDEWQRRALLAATERVLELRTRQRSTRVRDGKRPAPTT